MLIKVDAVFEDLMSTGLLERFFLDPILKEISELARSAGAPNLTFWFINGLERRRLPVEELDATSVVFIFDEQRAVYPEVVRRAGVVAQAYIADTETIASHHIPFPLGFSSFFTRSPYRVPQDRKLNVFFSGNLHRGRTEFHAWLSGVTLPFALRHRLQKALNLKFDRRFPSSHIRFTSNFGAGLPPETYSEMIADAKIVLCPPGSVSKESFRVYEAMAQGCVIITDGLPSRAFFSQCPVISVSKWSEVDRVVWGLLANPSKLAAVSLSTLEWFDTMIGPRNLAMLLWHSARAQQPKLT